MLPGKLSALADPVRNHIRFVGFPQVQHGHINPGSILINSMLKAKEKLCFVVHLVVSYTVPRT